jgi:hypothetical protein
MARRHGGVDRRKLVARVAALARGGGLVFGVAAEPQIHAFRLWFSRQRRHAVIDRALARLGQRHGRGARRGGDVNAGVADAGALDQLRHRGGAGLQPRLTDDQVLHRALDAVLIDELAAGHLIEPQPQGGDAVLVGVLHLGLAFEQPGQHIVAKQHIARRRNDPGADQRREQAAARQHGSGNLEASALVAARHMEDVIAGGLDKTVRLITLGHLTFPGRRGRPA